MNTLTENDLRLHIRSTLERLLSEAESKVNEGEDLIENNPEIEKNEEQIEEASIRSHAHGRSQSKRPETYPDQLKRDAIQEAAGKISNFIKSQPETATKQLNDTSKAQVLGDPLFDIDLNQLANELGSDGDVAPTVSITAGGENGGNGATAGQKKPYFSDKTKMA